MVRLIILAGLAIGIFSYMPHLVTNFMETNGYNDPGPSTYAVRTETNRDQARSSSSPGRLRLKADSRGHFLTRARVNGRSVRVLVDTGASSVVLSYEDARKIGLNPRSSDFTIRVQTANGEGRAARVKLRTIELGGIREDNIEAMIAPKGTLQVSLLGMTFLKKLKRFELSRNRLILEN
ncbi:retropepsin-like aspartic protease family protein [Cohaesibacter gelatinilyticus]|uniref:Aspartyl protease family protein n=1 Tax=Cohaesibacter gelatinilyticus TaxID=372072 RepID=A0A285PLG1_9HYPH|nr:TIGR02281 family clan AA aspartic protease [Cohaesibacter gelatinilyticus]SNZ20701.1 aspartyl protease family protein [Cohaesibacter gelatinilyticus]